MCTLRLSAYSSGPGIPLQRRGQEGLARDDQDRGLRRRAQRRPVRLGRQPVRVLRARAARARPSARSCARRRRRRLEQASRCAASETFESTAVFLPPARRATMSGRSAPSGVATATCSSKSQRALHPGQLEPPGASCGSPQRPLASGRRSAVTSACWISRAQLLRALPREGGLLGQRGVRPGPGRVGFPQLLLRPGPGFPAAARRDARPPRGGSSSSPAAFAFAACSRPSATSRNASRCSRTSACAARAWNRSASWPWLDERGPFGRAALDHPRLAQSAARAGFIRGQDQAGQVRGGGGGPGPRANRSPIAAPMTIPSSSSGKRRELRPCAAIGLTRRCQIRRRHARPRVTVRASMGR